MKWFQKLQSLIKDLPFKHDGMLHLATLITSIFFGCSGLFVESNKIFANCNRFMAKIWWLHPKSKNVEQP